MADTSTKVQGAVAIKNDSAERVAYELFHFIRGGTPEQQDESLELFARCLCHTRDPYSTVADVKRLVGKK